MFEDMAVRLESIDIGEDITLKVWINDKTGLVNSSLIRFEQDEDVLIVSGLGTIDNIITQLTRIRNEALETVKQSKG